MTIDLSEFINEPPRNTNKRDKLIDLLEPTIPPGQVQCPECKGAGMIDQQICLKCRKTGFITPPPRETAIRVIQWWSRFTCACGRKYDAPTFPNSITIEYTVHRPIVSKGRILSYRYSETIYRPTLDHMGRSLPFSIQYHDHHISACRSCTQSHLVILLPAPEENAA